MAARLALRTWIIRYGGHDRVAEDLGVCVNVVYRWAAGDRRPNGWNTMAILKLADGKLTLNQIVG